MSRNGAEAEEIITGVHLLDHVRQPIAEAVGVGGIGSMEVGAESNAVRRILPVIQER